MQPEFILWKPPFGGGKCRLQYSPTPNSVFDVSELTVAAESQSPSSMRKVVLLLSATGDAPILEQEAKFKILGTDKFAKVVYFLKRQLHRETFFVYVNSSFSPNPDELLIDLDNNFGSGGKLVVNYTCSMAWG